MFYLIGLGLGDVKDISVKGLEIVKKCDKIYLENYTSILTGGVEALEEYYGRSIVVADRDLVEQNADEILSGAKTSDVALLVVGDPYGATTHTDLVLRAKEQNIPCGIIHNASILNAIGCTGLQLYSFGETVSIPFWTENWQPDSFFDKICANFTRGLHTLCLLDIKVKEPTLESMTKKKKEYMPPRFMTVAEAASQILQVIDRRGVSDGIYKESLAIGVARVGGSDQQITACSLQEMVKCDLGDPLHSLVIPASKLHPLEEDYVNTYKKEI